MNDISLWKLIDNVGSIKAIPKARKIKEKKWIETTAASCDVPPSLNDAPLFSWTLGEFLIAQSGDRCRVGSWVFAEDASV